MFMSCSNKLDRGNAENIIEDFFEYPNVELINFPGVTSSQKLNNEYQVLRNQNYIKVERKGRYGNKFYVLLTVKGNDFFYSGKQNYNGYQVASSILKLNEVTGIRLNDGKNSAIVDYTLIREHTTPFANAKGFFDRDLIERQIVFQLYDDGWRIIDNKPQTIVKKENFLGFYEQQKKIEKLKAEYKHLRAKFVSTDEGDLYYYNFIDENGKEYSFSFVKDDSYELLVTDESSNFGQGINPIYKNEYFDIFYQIEKHDLLGWGKKEDIDVVKRMIVVE